MTTPIATARRNLSGRIERFLTLLDSEGRDPDEFEGEWTLRAIIHLKHDEWPGGEDAMRKAERRDMATEADLSLIPPPKAPITKAYLGDQLEKVVRQED